MGACTAARCEETAGRQAHHTAVLWCGVCPIMCKDLRERLVNRTGMLHQIAETEQHYHARRRRWPMFSWLSLTSGLFDRLKINFLSSVPARQGPNTMRLFTNVS
jgi:hypothetical protein